MLISFPFICFLKNSPFQEIEVLFIDIVIKILELFINL